MVEPLGRRAEEESGSWRLKTETGDPPTTVELETDPKQICSTDGKLRMSRGTGRMQRGRRWQMAHNRRCEREAGWVFMTDGVFWAGLCSPHTQSSTPSTESAADWGTTSFVRTGQTDSSEVNATHA